MSLLFINSRHVTFVSSLFRKVLVGDGKGFDKGLEIRVN